MALQDLTFDQADASSTGPDRLERYKGTEGATDRIAVVFFKPDANGKPDPSKARFLKGAIRYHAKLGSVLVDESIDPDVWEGFEESRDKAATLIVRYPTEPNGKPIKDKLATDTRVLLWEFGMPTLGALKNVNDSLLKSGKALGTVDLKLICKSAQYQRFDVLPVEPCIWQANPSYAAKLLEKVVPLYQHVKLGRELTEAQIRDAVGTRKTSPVEEFDNDVLDNLLEHV